MKRTLMGLMGVAVGAGLLAVVACAPGQDEGPLELRLAVNGNPSTYVADYQQDIDWAGTGLERRFGARYTLVGAGDGVGADRTTVRLDSLAAVMSTPHGRQVFDTRHLVGIEFELAISERGGIPQYPEDAPVLDMGPMMEREVSLSRLMNFGFPELPSDPVQVGDTWTTHSSRPQVEAVVHLMAEVTTEYRFAGWETVDGVDCARIEGRIAGEMEGLVGSEDDPAFTYAGTLQGNATWLLDPISGTLMSMTGDETSDGVLTQGEKETPIQQITRIQIGLADGS